MRVNARERINPTLQPLLIALDNAERIETLTIFCFKLLDELRSQNARIAVMSSTIADCKAELTKIQAYIEKWIPGHSAAVEHYVQNPPAAITDLHAEVTSLLGRFGAEADKSIALFNTPPESKPDSPA